MYILKYANKTKEIIELEGRLIELSLAYKMVQAAHLAEPILVEGKKEISGSTSILESLDQLSHELKNWHSHC